MRFTLSLSALAALSSAIHAQKIDIALYEAAVASNTNAKGPAVMPDATSELVSRAPAGVSANVKRVGGGSNIKARQEQACGCAPRATGAAPVPTPDTVTAFRNFQEYQNTASSAVTPGGFNQTFQGLNASVSQNGYLGFSTLDDYDTQACARFCNQADQCTAFNIYIERGPSTEVGPSCPDPASTAYYRCSIWGEPISNATATNTGYFVEDFEAAIAASNGYNRVAAPDSIANYTGPVALGGAIQAPLNANGNDTFLGSRMFAGAYNATQCADVCTETTEFERSFAQTNDLDSYRPCNFFNAYALSRNGEVGGTYCTMYTQAWGSEFATGFQSFDGEGNTFTVSNSYGYTAEELDDGTLE